MTSTVALRRPVERAARTRRFLMVSPRWFDVVYEINAWMDASVAVDPVRAHAQWQGLVRAYRAHGHQVSLLDPQAGLPDMVYAANGGTSLDTPAGSVFLLARFAHPQRAPEAAQHAAWHTAAGSRVVVAEHVNEGEGDFAVLADRVLAGHGFRTAPAAHAELAAVAGRPVESLCLVDERYYHLDTALCVLDDRRGEIAYLPEAFDAPSRARLEELYPTALRVAPDQAALFALNSVSDGRHVFHPAAATGFADQLRAAGFTPVPVELDELLRGGGSVKCCTAELR